MNTHIICKWNKKIVMIGHSTRIFAYDMAKAYIRDNFTGPKVKNYLYPTSDFKCPRLIDVVDLHKDSVLVFEFEDDTGSAEVTITAI